MEIAKDFLSVTNVVAASVVYLASLAFYRLFLHPLANFPGLRLAAITDYYEGYFDLVKNGQYTFKIGELHRQYGPIVRISPHELHVNDPAFFDTLYRRDAQYDKYAWTYDAFGVNGGTITTSPHELHKARRRPLAPFFSQAKVAKQQKMNRGHVSKLVSRLSRLAEAGTIFNLGAAMTALARDIANDFVLNKSYNSLDREDFDQVQTTMSQGAGGIWRLSKFIRFVAPTLQALPIPWLIKNSDPDTAAFFRHILDTQNDTKQLIADAKVRGSGDTKRRTIVDEIIDDSKLPHPEKEFKRVFEDVTTTTGVGFETTAGALRLIIYHVFSDKRHLHRLREELFSSTAIHLGASPDWKSLERLPDLSAVLHEGLRLSPAIGTRMARISQHAHIQYNQWRIPAGTPVGMTVVLMHYDPDVWPEARIFRPERWLNADGTFNKIEHAFALFSKGTRACLGQQCGLAWAEMYIALAEIAQRFDFAFIDASAAGFEASSDQFSIGTDSKGNLSATVSKHEMSAPAGPKKDDRAPVASRPV